MQNHVSTINKAQNSSSKKKCDFLKHPPLQFENFAATCDHFTAIFVTWKYYFFTSTTAGVLLPAPTGNIRFDPVSFGVYGR